MVATRLYVVYWYCVEMIDLGEIKKEYELIIPKLSDPELISNWEKFNTMTKRKLFLENIIEKSEKIKNLESQIEESRAILNAKEDPSLIVLAQEDIILLKGREEVLKNELGNLIKNEEDKNSVSKATVKNATISSHTVGGADLSLSKDTDGAAAVIVEIRAGTGGEEAALFAKDLFRMYTKYAQTQGWKQKILDSRESTMSGFKTVTFELADSNVFSKMKYEGGVHRIQRIPTTEKSERIHTSTATVAILPKPKRTKIKIKPEEIRVDLYRASGPGGQYVNKRETAVRLTHLPSNIVVTSQTERNQLKNKENALAILEARLLEKEEREAEEKASGKRRSQIGWAKRSEKIRTYNFPQDRLTDHRIKKSWKNLDKILAGSLDRIIETLEKSLTQNKEE